MQQTSNVATRAAVEELSVGVQIGHDRPRNRLLAALEPSALEALRPHLETVRFESGDILFEAHQTVTHVYFPETAGVVLMDVDQLQTSVAGTVGNEGMVGVGVFSGEATSSLLAATYLPGAGRRMTAETFRRMASVSGPMHQLALQYGHAFLRQVIAAYRCNSAHSVVQRCARWIVLSCGRADAAEIPLAIELLAVVIGAQRAGVSLGLRTLEQRGVIDCRPGFVHVLDQRALEEAACECTRMILDT